MTETSYIIEIYKEVLSGKRKIFPKNTWTCINAKTDAALCVRYLIEEVLHWDREQVCNGFNQSLLKRYKLIGMHGILFDSSMFKVLDNAYPDEYKPWELVSVPRGFWTKDSMSEALKWLLEEKLKWTRTQICQGLTIKTLNDNGLISLITYNLFDSIYEILDYTYPNQYKPWELSTISKSYWDDEVHIAQLSGGW